MNATHPDKQDVRKWMQQRQVEHVPPPAPEEVKRQLGWHLIEAEREALKNENDNQP